MRVFGEYEVYSRHDGGSSYYAVSPRNLLTILMAEYSGLLTYPSI